MKFNQIPGVKSKGEVHTVLQLAGITYYSQSPILEKIANWDYHLLTESDFAYLMVHQHLLLSPKWQKKQSIQRGMIEENLEEIMTYDKALKLFQYHLKNGYTNTHAVHL